MPNYVGQGFLANPENRYGQILVQNYFFRFNGDKIAEITEYYDLAAVLVQQGQLEL